MVGPCCGSLKKIPEVAFYRRNGFAFDGTEQKDPGAPGIVDARMVR